MLAYVDKSDRVPDPIWNRKCRKEGVERRLGGVDVGTIATRDAYVTRIFTGTNTTCWHRVMAQRTLGTTSFYHLVPTLCQLSDKWTTPT